MASLVTKRHKMNMKGIMLRRLAGASVKDKTGLLIRALDKIALLFDSKKHSDWEIALNNLNKLMPYAIPKESYEHPLLSIASKTGENGNTQVFIQLNQFMEDRTSRKTEINEHALEPVLKEIIPSLEKSPGQ